LAPARSFGLSVPSQPVWWSRIPPAELAEDAKRACSERRHAQSRCGMPHDVILSSRRCVRESLRCCLACRWCHRSRTKRYHMAPSQHTFLSIRTRATCCLISTCKIPANVPYKPRRGAPRWPQEPRSKTPEASRLAGLQGSGTLPMLSGWLRVTCWIMIPAEGSQGVCVRSLKICSLSYTPYAVQCKPNTPTHAGTWSECRQEGVHPGRVRPSPGSLGSDKARSVQARCLIAPV
jgi:hypothetical protein